MILSKECCETRHVDHIPSLNFSITQIVYHTIAQIRSSSQPNKDIIGTRNNHLLKKHVEYSYFLVLSFHKNMVNNINLASASVTYNSHLFYQSTNHVIFIFVYTINAIFSTTKTHKKSVAIVSLCLEKFVRLVITGNKRKLKQQHLCDRNGIYIHDFLI